MTRRTRSRARRKNPAAVTLGRLGGRASAKKLGPEGMRRIGRMGGRPPKKKAP